MDKEGVIQVLEAFILEIKNDEIEVSKIEKQDTEKYKESFSGTETFHNKKFIFEMKGSYNLEE